MADGIGMVLDLPPPLLFVPDPKTEDAVHALVCPWCFSLTAVWLGSEVAHCVVCETPFVVAAGEA